MLDVAIRNGTVVAGNQIEILDIGIDGGSIAAVGDPGSIGPAKETIDAEGLHVLPGAVDAHFHCRAPSHPERGTFGTETRAAVSGGVTTVFEMPISDPPCISPKVLRARRVLGEAEAYSDFALFAGAAVGSASKTTALAEAGAIGFKLFTHRPPEDRSQEFEGLWADTEDRILEALEAVAATGLTCTVHAENQHLIEKYESVMDDSGAPLRPPIIEAATIALIGALTQESHSRTHIAHMSSVQSVDALRGAVAGGADISGETCPHYLIFNETHLAKFGSFLKVAPPIRTDEHSKGLWDALKYGEIPIVASDHAPFTVEEKDVPYAAAPRGIPGVEMLARVIVDAAFRGKLPLELAVATISENPARRFGIFPRKGVLREGSDADISIWDSNGATRFSSADFVSRSGRSAVPYEGMHLRGSLLTVLVRGNTVYQNGRVMGEPIGAYVEPSDKEK